MRRGRSQANWDFKTQCLAVLNPLYAEFLSKSNDEEVDKETVFHIYKEQLLKGFCLNEALIHSDRMRAGFKKKVEELNNFTSFETYFKKLILEFDAIAELENQRASSTGGRQDF